MSKKIKYSVNFPIMPPPSHVQRFWVHLTEVAGCHYRGIIVSMWTAFPINYEPPGDRIGEQHPGGVAKTICLYRSATSTPKRIKAKPAMDCVWASASVASAHGRSFKTKATAFFLSTFSFSLFICERQTKYLINITSFYKPPRRTTSKIDKRFIYRLYTM